MQVLYFMPIMQCRTEIYDSCESSPHNLKVLERDFKPVYSNSTAQLFSHCCTQLPSRVCFRECAFRSHIFKKQGRLFTKSLHLLMKSWVGQKVSLILSKNKTYFSFSPRTLLNNMFMVLFHSLLAFFRQLHNSILPKLFIFLSTGLFQVPFTVFQGIEIFH